MEARRGDVRVEKRITTELATIWIWLKKKKIRWWCLKGNRELAYLVQRDEENVWAQRSLGDVHLCFQFIFNFIFISNNKKKLIKKKNLHSREHSRHFGISAFCCWKVWLPTRLALVTQQHQLLLRVFTSILAAQNYIPTASSRHLGCTATTKMDVVSHTSDVTTVFVVASPALENRTFAFHVPKDGMSVEILKYTAGFLTRLM